MTPDIQATQDSASPLPLSDDAISSAIGKIMEHPELISMVAYALGGNAGKSVAVSAEVTETDSQSEVQTAPPSSLPSTDAVTTLLPLLKGLSLGGGGKDSGKSGFRHEPLLRALKPYVSHSRGQAIDYILRISQISGLLGKLR